MTKKRLWLTVALSALIAPAVVHAQGEPEYGIKFGGFVKFDAFNDTRQVIAARDDMFLLYPAARSQINAAPAGKNWDTALGLPAGTIGTLNPISDASASSLYPFIMNEDLNANGQTGMTAIQSRLSGKITGPDAFGAKVTGLIEMDFFGNGNYNTAMTRLRHAWVNLDWGKTSFRAGQDWHPLFLQGGIFPGTLQFNPLAPIHPFGRAPQVAFTVKPVEGFRLSVYALEQVYHADVDPTLNATQTAIAQPSGKALRTAKIPELAVQADYKIGGFTIGGTYDRKTIVPLQTTPALNSAVTTAQVGQNTNGVTYQIYQAFAQLKQGDLTLKASTTWGDNWGALLGTGGYAPVQSTVDRNVVNAIVGSGASLTEALQAVTTYQAFTKREYTPTRSRGFWAEVAYGKELEFAIVGGKVENLGASKEIDAANLVGARAGIVKQVITIAPRIKYTSGKTMFGLEYIYSRADYMEDDKNYQALINWAKGGADTNSLANYKIGTGTDYTTLTASSVTFANSAVRDSQGKIGDTYTVTNHRIQFSVQQNF